MKSTFLTGGGAVELVDPKVGGGAVELVLETPKSDYYSLPSLHSVPNSAHFYHFPTYGSLGCQRLPLENNNNNKKTILGYLT